MDAVKIKQHTFNLDQQVGNSGACRFSLWHERRLSGWRGWLGATARTEVAWLDIGRKGADSDLCHEQQGIFAVTTLHVQPDWQNAGLGSYLLLEGMRHARKQGMVLAGELPIHHDEALFDWFLKRGLDIVESEKHPGHLLVLGRKAKTAPHGVTMTRLIHPDQHLN